jgi:hypothetical protein
MKALPIGHLLGHVKEQLTILVIGLAQQAAKLVEETSFFAGATPGNVITRLALGQVRQLRRFFTVVEELIEWAFEGTRQLFQRFDGRDSVSIFNAGDVATKKAGTFLDITLGEFLFLAQSAKTVTDNHELSIPQLVK